MSIVIVGHGPSLLDRSIGDEIDSFDTVVRLKRFAPTLSAPHAYGTKTHVSVGSWGIKDFIPKVPGGELWCFIDSRYTGKVTDEEIATYQRMGWYINRSLCDVWNERFRNLRTPYELWSNTVVCKSSTPGLGHDHLSAGFHALLYACEKNKPEAIYLAGFDNVMAGTFTWSVTRGPQYTQYPDHRWDIESSMLELVSDEYEVEIKAL